MPAQTVRLHPSGHEVAVHDGDTVLMALERAGYALPNNCRAGACGECKVRVLAGHFDQGMVLDMALAQDERKQGFGLMCMAKPLSPELVIEWGTSDARPQLFPPREEQAHVITEKLRRTARIVELRLRPIDAALRFWPGQYVLLGEPDRTRPRRPYSLAAAPRPDGELTLQITRVDGGCVSTWVHDRLAPGELVSVSGPHGTFVGDPSVQTPVLCMAAGSGLAPILSLTEAALRRGFNLPVTLLFSAREPGDLYEGGLLAYWSRRHPNFRWQPILTGSGHGGPFGRIPARLPDLFPDLSGHSVFIAGSPAFVADCERAARRLGAPERHLHTEGYFAQQPAQAATT